MQYAIKIQDSIHNPHKSPVFNTNDIFWKFSEFYNKKYPEIPHSNGGFYAEQIEKDLARVIREAIDRELIKYEAGEQSISINKHSSLFVTPKGYAYSKGWLFRALYWLAEKGNFWILATWLISSGSLVVSIIALRNR